MFSDDLNTDEISLENNFFYNDLSLVQDAIKEFLFLTLPIIKDKIKEPLTRNEKSLSSDIADWLSVSACSTLQLFSFRNEAPDNRSATRIMDIKSKPRLLNPIYCGGIEYDATDTLLDIEVKILPTPIDRKEDRSREYVVGAWSRKTEVKKPCKGGIERFKEEQHAPNMYQAVLLALVKEGKHSCWQNEINNWIEELICNPIPSHKALWSENDKIIHTKSNKAISRYESFHARIAKEPIKIQHLFLKLN